MPSFFHKHNDTAPSGAPPNGVDTSLLPPMVAFPEPKTSDEDLSMAKDLDGAFRAIGDAKESDQKYSESKSLKVLNTTGMSP